MHKTRFRSTVAFFSQEICPLCYFHKLSNTSLMGHDYSNHNKCCRAVANLTYLARNCNSKRVLSLLKGAVRMCYVKDEFLKNNSCTKFFREPALFKCSGSQNSSNIQAVLEMMVGAESKYTDEQW